MTTPVKSSNITSVAVEGDDLIVTFRGGGTYRYRGAARHHDDLVRADSPGKHLRANVMGKYEHGREK